MKATAADIATALLVVAGIFVLTRPGSQGAKFFATLGATAIGLVGTATGQNVKTSFASSRPAPLSSRRHRRR